MLKFLSGFKRCSNYALRFESEEKMRKIFAIVLGCLIYATASAAIVVPEFEMKFDDEVVVESDYNYLDGEKDINTPYIIIFQNIERFVYENEEKMWIRIYDEQWNLVIATNGAIDLELELGRYVIQSEMEISYNFTDVHDDIANGGISWLY